MKLSVALILLTLSVPVLAEELPCEALTSLKQAQASILTLVKDSPDDQSMRAGVEKVMEKFVDFNEFGRLSLGKQWKGLTPDQQKRYLVEFRDLLKRTYLRRFDRGSPFTVIWRSGCKANKRGTRIQVQTTIRSAPKTDDASNGDVGEDVEADVDYRFHKSAQADEQWMVYDIVVDEVSMMRNYRKSFLRVLKNDGFEQLIAKMKKKKSDRDE